jgi:hypothetical protein
MESPFPRCSTSRERSPNFNYPPGLYALVNAYIGTNLSNDDQKIIKEIRKEGWANILRFEQVKYATLDARLEFEIARKHFQLAGYNSHVDRLNVACICTYIFMCDTY